MDISIESGVNCNIGDGIEYIYIADVKGHRRYVCTGDDAKLIRKQIKEFLEKIIKDEIED